MMLDPYFVQAAILRIAGAGVGAFVSTGFQFDFTLSLFHRCSSRPILSRLLWAMSKGPLVS